MWGKSGKKKLIYVWNLTLGALDNSLIYFLTSLEMSLCTKKLSSALPCRRNKYSITKSPLREWLSLWSKWIGPVTFKVSQSSKGWQICYLSKIGNCGVDLKRPKKSSQGRSDHAGLTFIPLSRRVYLFTLGAATDISFYFILFNAEVK